MAFSKNGKSESLGIVKSGAIEPKEQETKAEADKKPVAQGTVKQEN